MRLLYPLEKNMKPGSQKLFRTLILVVFTGLLAISPAQESNGLKKVVLALHWQPQAQFAGYYMALTKGIYKKYGLDVSIRHTGFKDNAIDLLRTGSAHFITNFLSGSLEEYEKGLNLRLIAQTSRKSALTIAGLKSRGIKQLSDLNNKKIAIWQAGFRELPQAFLTKYGLNSQFVPVRSTVNLFLMGGVDAQVVMDYNELNSIIFSGVKEEDLTLFRIAEYGLNVPEDGIYCSASFLEKNKGLAEKFVKATMEGWIEAFNNKEETVEFCVDLKRKNGLQANRAHQMRMLKTMEAVIQPRNNTLNTYLDPGMFNLAIQVLKDAGRIEGNIKYYNFYVQVVK